VPATLRIEIFPDDLDAFVDFYTRVLAFDLVSDRRTTDHPYAAVARDGIRIGAAPAWTPVERAARAVPTGVEIVIEVDDVDAEHDRVVESGWPLESDLRTRPWSLTDFRMYDPAGHYIRITSRS
jgi:predicted enzyme related to lactoylglutathione lyase